MNVNIVVEENKRISFTYLHKKMLKESSYLRKNFTETFQKIWLSKNERKLMLMALRRNMENKKWWYTRNIEVIYKEMEHRWNKNQNQRKYEER